MSIATKRGDGGQTGLAGGIRVSKSSLRVESYGSVDELNSALGLARSICEDADLRERTKSIQRELFRIGSGLATPPESSKPQVPIAPELVDDLTKQVYELEATEGLLSDWSLPGETTSGAAYDVARTVCRRAERRLSLRRRNRALRPIRSRTCDQHFQEGRIRSRYIQLRSYPRNFARWPGSISYPEPTPTNSGNSGSRPRRLRTSSTGASQLRNLRSWPNTFSN